LSSKNDKQTAFPENISYLCELINDVRRDVVSIENINANKYLKSLNELQSFLFSHLFIDQKWNSVRGFIDDKNLDLIESCSEIIESRHQKFVEIDPDKIQVLKDDLRKIIDEIANSDLPKDIKSQIVSGLRKIEEALLTYSIRGVQGVVHANDSALGNSIFCLSLLESDTGRSLIKKVTNFCFKVASTYRDIEALQRLGASASQLPDFFKDVFQLPPSS
jgi:hypothetical protein